jgi:hypothetical protein
MAEFIGMILDYKAINYAYENVLQIESSSTESTANPLNNIFSDQFRKIANKIVIKDEQSIINEIENNNKVHNFNDFCVKRGNEYVNAETKNSLTLPDSTKYNKLYISKEFINKYLNEIK